MHEVTVQLRVLPSGKIQGRTGRTVRAVVPYDPHRSLALNLQAASWATLQRWAWRNNTALGAVTRLTPDTYTHIYNVEEA